MDTIFTIQYDEEVLTAEESFTENYDLLCDLSRNDLIIVDEL